MNSTYDDNVSVILTLIFNRNTTLYAVCPPPVTITPSGGPPYEAGHQLTCAADGIDLTYEWSGTNGGSPFSVTSNTVTLEEGEFCLICTATENSVSDCSACAFLCDNATGKCRKQYSQIL